MGYKIAYVEDDALILDLVTSYLRSTGLFDEIHTYVDGKLFLTEIGALHQDLDAIVLDFKLGATNAELILKDLVQNGIKVPPVVLTSNYNQYLLGHMIRSGAAGYFPKNIKPEDLLHVLQEVIAKGHYISADQFPYLKIAFSDPGVSSHGYQHIDISDREIEVIYLLANQLTAKEISDKLCVSPKTVEGYKNALFTKTKTKNVVGLVVYALQNGLINADEIDLVRGV